MDSLVFNTTVPDGVSGEWLLKIIDLGLAFPYYSHFSRGHGRFWKPLMGVFSLRLVYVDGLAFVEGVRWGKTPTEFFSVSFVVVRDGYK